MRLEHLCEPGAQRKSAGVNMQRQRYWEIFKLLWGTGPCKALISYIWERELYGKRERLFRIWKEKLKILHPHFLASKMKYLLKESINPYLVIWYSFIWAHFHVIAMIRNLNGVGSLVWVQLLRMAWLKLLKVLFRYKLCCRHLKQYVPINSGS